MSRTKPRPDAPKSKIFAAARQVGAAVEFASADTWYVSAPTGKSWAVDPEGHVLQVVRWPAHMGTEWLEMALGWIAAGLVDCQMPDCAWCNREAIEAGERDRQVGLDSAYL
ncbi:MAG: hypothetical protein ACJ72N_07490 [Labedaea sp.]